jgi:CRP-like cAMP-binding protein
VAGPVEGRAVAARDTAPVDDLLSLAQGHPRRILESGDPLIVDGEPVSALFVLLEGQLRVEKVGVPIAIVRERGACIGEISLLLGVSATADVVASERSVVAVVENAQTTLDAEPRLPLALARILAERLHLMNNYLVDLKQQYAVHEGGLGMVDVVLGGLMRSSGTRSELGSERDPDPEY